MPAISCFVLADARQRNVHKTGSHKNAIPWRRWRLARPLCLHYRRDAWKDI